MKIFVTALFMLLFSLPASAKDPDVYPVNCTDLWAAVNATLSNQGNYRLVASDDPNKWAAFIVVGGMKQFTDKVSLSTLDNGCKMNLVVTQIGSDNSDEREFPHRLGKSLAKLQTAKPAAPAKSVPGT